MKIGILIIGLLFGSFINANAGTERLRFDLEFGFGSEYYLTAQSEINPKSIPLTKKPGFIEINRDVIKDIGSCTITLKNSPRSHKNIRRYDCMFSEEGGRISSIIIPSTTVTQMYFEWTRDNQLPLEFNPTQVPYLEFAVRKVEKACCTGLQSRYKVPNPTSSGLFLNEGRAFFFTIQLKKKSA